VTRGFGRLVCYDEDPTDSVIFSHHGFSCDVLISGNSDLKPDDYSTFKLLVAVTGTVGTLFTRENAGNA